MMMHTLYQVCGGMVWIILLAGVMALVGYLFPRYQAKSAIAGLLIFACGYSTLMHNGAYDGPIFYQGGLLGQAWHALLSYAMPQPAIIAICWIIITCGIMLIVGYRGMAFISQSIFSLYTRNHFNSAQITQSFHGAHSAQHEPYHDEPEADDFLEELIVKTKPACTQEADVQASKAYPFPELEKISTDQQQVDKNSSFAQHKAQILEEKLLRFGIKGSVTSITAGPVVTLYEYQPHIDAKISKIIAREDDLALALQAVSLRIIAPIPGKSVVGFEVAQVERTSVYFGTLYEQCLKKFKGHLPLLLGQNTIGSTVVVDLISMPHLLVAGSTGSGKSVALNTMLISLLCYAKPEDLKLILIDPKKLEFAVYADLPHLLFPIVTEPERAIAVLRWAVQTMQSRYERMAKAGVRQAKEYHALYHDMASIVIIIDEFADLMITTGKEIEELIVRLAQMARAAGIHIILATQRPSVDVITGLIKVNFPARIAFKVTSKIDSRTIIDTIGADKLLGKGDMLFLDNQGMLNRIHGAYISDAEIASVVEQIKSYGAPVYETLSEVQHGTSDDIDEADKKIFEEIVQYVRECDEISISLLQRKFRIGYNRSARMMDTLESRGIILPSDGGKMRKVLH